MSNENNLYFLQILMKAFESEEPIETMEKALLEITELGEQEEFSEGYKQFNQFLEAGLENQEGKYNELIDKLLIGLISESLNISSEKQKEYIKKIELNQNLHEKYNQLKKEYLFSIPLKLEIYRNETMISSQTISQKEDELNFSNIEPGNYSVNLSNGRVLWKGEIKTGDVKLDESEENREYSLAAETEEVDIKPIRVIELIKDEIYLYVFAGLEFGRFKIIIK